MDQDRHGIHEEFIVIQLKIRMNEELLHLISAKAKSTEFRILVGQLLERRAGYEAIKTWNNKIGKELRAKREAIAVEQIEMESEKAVAGMALRADERNRFSDRRKQRVETAKGDSQLLRMILSSNQIELDQQERWLMCEGLPIENRPLKKELVSFLKETRRCITAFAESNGWSITPTR